MVKPVDLEPHPDGRYHIPRAAEFVGIDVVGADSHLRIHFRIDDGSDLYLPISLNALEGMIVKLAEYADFR